MKGRFPYQGEAALFFITEAQSPAPFGGTPFQKGALGQILNGMTLRHADRMFQNRGPPSAAPAPVEFVCLSGGFKVRVQNRAQILTI